MMPTERESRLQEEAAPESPARTTILSVADHCDLHRREHRRIIRQLQKSLARMQYTRIRASRDVS